MDNIIKCILFWAGTSLIGWFYYSFYFSTNSNVGYIDSDQVAYIKGIGTVTRKTQTASELQLHFTYPKSDNTQQGILSVSQSMFDKTNLGDTFPIFYGKQFPHLWMPVRQGKIFYFGLLLLFFTALPFLGGLVFFFKAVKSVIK